MMEPIAHIETPYKEKFGVPRQAGLVDCEARVVFEPRYRVAEAVRGLEDFEYIWLVWQFHLAQRTEWSPTVRPPRLGGNQRIGVFASRSPFRPNPIGLSSVRLLGVELHTSDGPVLTVHGADLVDCTPILDIKPYIAYADAHPEARCGYAQESPVESLRLVDDHGRLARLPKSDRQALEQVLRHDPRPHYQHDAQRVYSMAFGQWEVRFRVDGEWVEVVEIEEKKMTV